MIFQPQQGTWLERLGKADTNPLVSAGLALLTTGQGSNPLATAFQSFTNAAKNKQVAQEAETQKADLKTASANLLGAQDYNTYQQALASYAALPGADKDLMSTTAAIQREKLTGVPIQTGMIVDPSTGQQTYRDPIPFSTVLDQKKQLADLSYEDQQRMSELEYKYQQQGLDANQSRQKAQEEWMASSGYGNYYQAPSQGGAGGGSVVFDPSTGGMVYEQGPTKGQQQAMAGVYAADMKDVNASYKQAASAAAATSQLVGLAQQLTTSPIVNSAAGWVEGTVGHGLGGEAGAAMANLDQALTPAAMGVHPGGPMTDADLAAYRSSILNVAQSTESRVAAAKRAELGAKANLATLNAKRDYYDAHSSLQGFNTTVGAQIQAAYEAELAKLK